MKPLKWFRDRVAHKFEHLKASYLLSILKENGMALFVIIILWEVIEDVLFPLLFAFLGKNLHSVFYMAVPIGWLLCLHWLAVPLMWGAWIKLWGKKEENSVCHECDHKHPH